MAKYPERLKIGDRYYRIRFVKSIRRDKRAIGLCDEARAEILIHSGLSDDEKLKTLFHELLHAMEFEYNIKIPHHSIYQYEEAIFDFFCANSDLIWPATGSTAGKSRAE